MNRSLFSSVVSLQLAQHFQLNKVVSLKVEANMKNHAKMCLETTFRLNKVF